MLYETLLARYFLALLAAAYHHKDSKQNERQRPKNAATYPTKVFQ